MCSLYLFLLLVGAATAVDLCNTDCLELDCWKIDDPMATHPCRHIFKGQAHTCDFAVPPKLRHLEAGDGKCTKAVGTSFIEECKACDPDCDLPSKATICFDDCVFWKELPNYRCEAAD
jgi:hypothetical protein